MHYCFLEIGTRIHTFSKTSAFRTLLVLQRNTETVTAKMLFSLTTCDNLLFASWKPDIVYQIADKIQTTMMLSRPRIIWKVNCAPVLATLVSLPINFSDAYKKWVYGNFWNNKWLVTDTDQLITSGLAILSEIHDLLPIYDYLTHRS